MKPYFLWDYNLSDKQVRQILKSGDEFSRTWLVARILESAKFSDVWKYLTVKEVLEIFLKLRLKKPIKEVWEKAFTAWGYNYGNFNTAAKKVS